MFESVMNMESVLVQIGEKVYEENRGKLEKVYSGKVVAIEIESRKIAGVGESVDEAYRAAIKKYPKKQFYFRKVGKERAAGYLFLVE